VILPALPLITVVWGIFKKSEQSDDYLPMLGTSAVSSASCLLEGLLVSLKFNLC